LTRRSLGALAAAVPLGLRSARAQSAPRVVVVGGGCGGATVARYLTFADQPIAVTLVEPKQRYTTCFGSNLYLAGLRSFESLTHGYEALTQRHGVRVIHDSATGIDPVAKTVQLGGGERLTYDRLVVAPGIAFREGAIAGYDAAATQIMPHAWMAGPQTTLLRSQLEAMPDGGVFVMVVPADPFRCPPGPYERASLIAAYFKQAKPRAKIQILDAKDAFFEQDLFEEAWNRLYNGMIEWLPGQFIGPIEGVDPQSRSIRTASEVFKADVANVIPPQMAGAIARQAGLADATGWCPVDPITFESKLQPGIHLVGDAVSVGEMPKSAFAATSQAKTCAFAIAAALTGAESARPFLYNTCYTYLAANDAVSDAITFKIAGDKTAISTIQITKPEETTAVRAQTAREGDAWYGAFTRDIFG
jgi:NADPH-dependent 2,4-dienoyl-CoA reductase/sulfur reductase-like enzyme